MTGGGRAAQALSKIEVPNFLVVAIDTQLRDYLKEKGVNVWYKDIQACPSSLALALPPPPGVRLVTVRALRRTAGGAWRFRASATASRSNLQPLRAETTPRRRRTTSMHGCTVPGPVEIHQGCGGGRPCERH